MIQSVITAIKLCVGIRQKMSDPCSYLNTDTEERKTGHFRRRYGIGIISTDDKPCNYTRKKTTSLDLLYCNTL